MDEDKNKSIQVKDKMEKEIVEYSKEFIDSTKEFKKMWAGKYQEMSEIKTIHKSKKREIGRGKKEDYLEGSYMTALLDKHFPGWDYIPAHDPILLPVKQGEKLLIIAGGVLEIIDEYKFKFLTKIGVPPENADYKRRFYGLGGGMFHASKNTGNVIHASNPAKSAVTEGLKYAINRLTHVGDDTYRREESESLPTEDYVEIRLLIETLNLTEKDKEEARKKLLSVTSRSKTKFIEILKSKEIKEKD